MNRDFIDLIKDSNPIEEVAGEFFELKNQKTLCFLHKEKTPSLSFNVPQQYFYCFGCRVGGDVIRLIKLYKEVSFIDAIKYLANRAGISCQESNQEDQEIYRLFEDRKLILQATVRYYLSKLTKEVKFYLKDRGLSEEQIRKYQFGFAKGGLCKYLRSNSFDMSECVKAGVIKIDKYGEYKDYFYKRIVIPNIVRGDIVHLTGRSLENSDPKYLHLPGSIDYFWGEISFLGKEVIVCEGPFDAIALKEWGYNAVALLGCKLKEEWKNKLLKAKSVTFLLDGDKAGLEGAIDATQS